MGCEPMKKMKLLMNVGGLMMSDDSCQKPKSRHCPGELSLSNKWDCPSAAFAARVVFSIRFQHHIGDFSINILSLVVMDIHQAKWGVKHQKREFHGMISGISMALYFCHFIKQFSGDRSFGVI